MTAEEALDGLFVHCIAIQPADIEKSLWFYKEVLGFQETMHLKEESFEIWLLGYPAKTYPRRELARIELIHSTVSRRMFCMFSIMYSVTVPR